MRKQAALATLPAAAAPPTAGRGRNSSSLAAAAAAKPSAATHSDQAVGVLTHTLAFNVSSMLGLWSSGAAVVAHCGWLAM